MQNFSADDERRALAVLQKGFPSTPTPYQDMARQAGLDTKRFLKILQEWKKEGKLRRIGAIVNPFKVGIDAGAMVAWQVEPDQTEEVGTLFAGFEQVSHAYERHTAKNWPYTIYTMVHGSSNEEVQKTVCTMSETARVSTYRILMTERELKKVPPTYIVEANP